MDINKYNYTYRYNPPEKTSMEASYVIDILKNGKTGPAKFDSGFM